MEKGWSALERREMVPSSSKKMQRNKRIEINGKNTISVTAKAPSYYSLHSQSNSTKCFFRKCRNGTVEAVQIPWSVHQEKKALRISLITRNPFRERAGGNVACRMSSVTYTSSKIPAHFQTKTYLCIRAGPL